MDQVTAGWIGFWASLVGCAAGLLSGKLGDIFGRLKAILIALNILALIGSLWIVLIVNGYIPYQTRSIWAATIILSIACTAVLPIIFEMAVEALYPIDESVALAVLSVVVQLLQSVFLAVLFAKQISTGWTNWFMMAGIAVSVPLMIAVPGRYRRSGVDNQQQDCQDNQRKDIKY